MTEFSLSFMSFCEEDYERQYCEKIENFLRLIVPLTPAQSSSTASFSVAHKPAYLNCFSPILQEKLIFLQDDHSVPFVQVRRFEDYGVNIICSPSKHCRQRVRFAVFAIEDKAQFTIIGDEDKRELEPYHSLSQSVISEIESKVAVSRESSQSSLYYCMWEGGSPSVIVQVRHSIWYLHCLYKVNLCLGLPYCVRAGRLPHAHSALSESELLCPLPRITSHPLPLLDNWRYIDHFHLRSTFKSRLGGFSRTASNNPNRRHHLLHLL